MKLGWLIAGAATTALKLEVSLGKSAWQPYAEVADSVLTAQSFPQDSLRHIVQPLSNESNFCVTTWDAIKGAKSNIQFRALNDAGSEVGLSTFDLAAVRNWRQFCRLLANTDFVVELSPEGLSVDRVLAKPPAAEQEQVTAARLGFVSVMGAEPADELQLPAAPAILPDAPQQQREPPRSNWWWGFLIAMLVMQVLNAIQAAKAPAPASG